jgi:hypothetical protein
MLASEPRASITKKGRRENKLNAVESRRKHFVNSKVFVVRKVGVMLPQHHRSTNWMRWDYVRDVSLKGKCSSKTSLSCKNPPILHASETRLYFPRFALQQAVLVAFLNILVFLDRTYLLLFLCNIS